MRTIVSILSEQPIPTVLFIKQLSTMGDRYIFLSTKEMEQRKKSEIIADVLSLKPGQYNVIEIDANSPALILEALDTISWSKGEEIVVNITGGTKMMSQMAYIYFSDLENVKAQIYYWPIGAAHLEQLHPVIEEVPITNPVSLNLEAYFRAHGFDILCQKELSYPFERADGLFKSTLRAGSILGVDEIMKAKSDDYLGQDKMYLMGGWFEEWLYGFLKRELRLKDDMIAFNLKLKNRASEKLSESDNEIDVAFVYKNQLLLWECKVYSSMKLKGQHIATPIYKISSVSQTLGLQANSNVAILSRFGNDEARDAYIRDITRLMRVKRVFSMEDFKRLPAFIETVKAQIGYE